MENHKDIIEKKISDAKDSMNKCILDMLFPGCGNLTEEESERLRVEWEARRKELEARTVEADGKRWEHVDGYCPNCGENGQWEEAEPYEETSVYCPYCGYLYIVQDGYGDIKDLAAKLHKK
jgi:DNA-directed RNA polymerase subunit RPC12/RpoP